MKNDIILYFEKSKKATKMQTELIYEVKNIQDMSYYYNFT